MVSARLRPSHKIRRAVLHAPLCRRFTNHHQVPQTLSEYFSAFDPSDDIELPPPCQLRWRSAPWDDIIDEDIPEVDDSADGQHSEASYDTEEDIDGSPQINLLTKRLPPPTVSAAIPPREKKKIRTHAMLGGPQIWSEQHI
jgi:hypothetical protein